MTHWYFLSMLVVPVLMVWLALEFRESAAFERSMAALVPPNTIELQPQIIELARASERAELRAWLAAAAFIALWLGAAALSATRDRSRVARLLRAAVSDDANRDRHIASAVALAIEKKLLG